MLGRCLCTQVCDSLAIPAAALVLASISTQNLTALMAAVIHPNMTDRCAHFASALLSGKVIQGIGKLESLLNVKPSHVATATGRTLRRVSDFIAVLETNGIDDRRKLVSRWQVDGVHLLMVATLACWRMDSSLPLTVQCMRPCLRSVSV